MKHLGLVTLIAISCIFYSLNEFTSEKIFATVDKPSTSLRQGDIIFQTSGSGQSYAIQLATNSKYSHCGLVEIVNGSEYVFEAVQPVKLTPLKDWVKNGNNGHYVVKRLKDTTKLTKSSVKILREEAKLQKGKNYDIYFDWSDYKMYCSELVWKLYKRAFGVEVGELQELKEFDLTNPIVKAKLKERYGNAVPLNEKVIFPAAIFNSDLLHTLVSIN